MTVFIHSISSWLELVSLAFVIGLLACSLLVFPSSSLSELSRPADFSARAWRFFGIALGVIFVGSTIDLFIRTAGMSGRPVSEVFPIMSTVLFHTHYGRVWMLRLAALLLLSLFSVIELRHRNSSIFLIAALFLTVFVAATKSASGHASDAGDLSVAEIMDWFHLVAASAWGGGLFVLSLLILPEIVRQNVIPAHLLASVAGRFSRMAGLAVAVLAITALYNAWLHVGNLKGLWLTPYGETVIIKSLLFFLLINLGAFNRYVSVPLLQRLGGIDPGRMGLVGRLADRIMTRLRQGLDTRTAALRFMKSVRTEAILIVMALLCAALLAQQVPARHAMHAMSAQGHNHSMGNNR